MQSNNDVAEFVYESPKGPLPLPLPTVEGIGILDPFSLERRAGDEGKSSFYSATP
jgi:hypothetical protein